MSNSSEKKVLSGLEHEKQVIDRTGLIPPNIWALIEDHQMSFDMHSSPERQDINQHRLKKLNYSTTIKSAVTHADIPLMKELMYTFNVRVPWRLPRTIMNAELDEETKLELLKIVRNYRLPEQTRFSDPYLMIAAAQQGLIRIIDFLFKADQQNDPSTDVLHIEMLLPKSSIITSPIISAFKHKQHKAAEHMLTLGENNPKFYETINDFIQNESDDYTIQMMFGSIYENPAFRDKLDQAQANHSIGMSL